MIYMIYFIEDDRSINEAVFYSLKNSGFEVKGFEKPSEFWKAMKEGKTPDLILLATLCYRKKMVYRYSEN